MVVFPNCKINLGLNILFKRSDGYHELETVFYPLPLTDALEITEDKKPRHQPSFTFTMSGLAIKGDTATNLCVKAWRLLKKDFPGLPHMQMHLHKVIPSGAGLGGGSADASFLLKLLNEKFKLGLSTPQLINYSASLGSDCPFFILNKPCFAKGRGELLEEIEIGLLPYKFVIVNPGIHIDTGRAFLNTKPAIPERSLMQIIKGPIEKWKDALVNDFEKFVFKEYREIVDIKDELYLTGAIYASLSGSGSSVYGIFPREKRLKLSFPANYFVREL